MSYRTLTALLSGHLGSTAAEYTSQTLPDAIYGRLWEFVQSIGGRLDRSNIATHQAQLTKLLKDEIEAFDKAIGDAVREICPRPEDLTEEQARRLIDKHKDILERAFYGTTMVFALINPDERFMWAAGVGDSSVGEYRCSHAFLWRRLTLHRALLHWQGRKAKGPKVVQDAHVQGPAGVLPRHHGASR